MEAPADHRRTAKPAPDYRSLPSSVRLDETIASVDAVSVPEPTGDRNDEQHRALRDD